MIEFHLDGRSGVSPYLQLVQQVRRALRLGLLSEGDQLPTVKDVVGKLAINPNTVLKAYRELEHEGLAAARPGVGTFVTRTLTDNTLAAHGPLRLSLGMAGEGAAGGPRRGEHRGAVPGHLSLRAEGGDGMSTVLAAGPRQEVPPQVGALRLHARDPRRPGRRPGRPQRRRQEDLPQARGRDDDPDAGEIEVLGGGRPAATPSGRGSGSSARTPRRTPG